MMVPCKRPAADADEGPGGSSSPTAKRQVVAGAPLTLGQLCNRLEAHAEANLMGWAAVALPAPAGPGASLGDTPVRVLAARAHALLAHLRARLADGTSQAHAYACVDTVLKALESVPQEELGGDVDLQALRAARSEWGSGSDGEDDSGATVDQPASASPAAAATSNSAGAAVAAAAAAPPPPPSGAVAAAGAGAAPARAHATPLSLGEVRKLLEAQCTSGTANTMCIPLRTLAKQHCCADEDTQLDDVQLRRLLPHLATLPALWSASGVSDSTAYSYSLYVTKILELPQVQDCCSVEGTCLEELKAHFIAARASFRTAANRTTAAATARKQRAAGLVRDDAANTRASRSSAAAAAADNASAPQAADERQAAAATEAGGSGATFFGRSLAAAAGGAGSSGAAGQRQQQGGGVTKAAASAAAAAAADAAPAAQGSRCDTLGQLTALLRKQHAANLPHASNVLTPWRFLARQLQGQGGELAPADVNAVQLSSLFPQLHTLPQLWRDSARPISTFSANNYTKYVSGVLALPEVAAHFATPQARQQQEAVMRQLREAVQAYTAGAKAGQASKAAAATGAARRCDTLGQLAALLRSKHPANPQHVTNVLTPWRYLARQLHGQHSVKADVNAVQLDSLFPQLHTLPQLWRQADGACSISAGTAGNYLQYVSQVLALPEVAAHFATPRARQQQQAVMRQLKEAVQAYTAGASTPADAAPKQQRSARPAALKAPTVAPAAGAAAAPPPPPVAAPQPAPAAAASGEGAAGMLTAQQTLLHTFRTQLQLSVATLLRWKAAAKLLQTLPDEDERVRFFWLQHEFVLALRDACVDDARHYRDALEELLDKVLQPQA